MKKWNWGIIVALVFCVIFWVGIIRCFAEKVQNGQVVETEITFSVQEAQAAIGLFDIATKSGGLQVAEPAIILTKKLQEAFKMKPEPVKEEKK